LFLVHTGISKGEVVVVATAFGKYDQVHKNTTASISIPFPSPNTGRGRVVSEVGFE